MRNGSKLELFNIRVLLQSPLFSSLSASHYITGRMAVHHNYKKKGLRPLVSQSCQIKDWGVTLNPQRLNYGGMIGTEMNIAHTTVPELNYYIKNRVQVQFRQPRGIPNRVSEIYLGDVSALKHARKYADVPIRFNLMTDWDKELRTRVDNNCSTDKK